MTDDNEWAKFSTLSFVFVLISIGLLLRKEIVGELGNRLLRLFAVNAVVVENHI